MALWFNCQLIQLLYGLVALLFNWIISNLAIRAIEQ